MSIIDLIFPKKCLGCGKTGQYFCSECCSKIRPVEFQICPVCERASPFGQTHKQCLTKLSLSGFCSIFFYGGAIKEAIHKLKFRFATDLVEELWKISDFLLEEKRERDFFLLNKFLIEEKPIVIPVPLFWYKENFRGFNQAEILGRFLSKRFNLTLEKELLIRSIPTQPQAGLSQKERRKNIEKAFSVSSNILISSSPNILLVDDIWTTGSTLKTCSRLLKKAGVKKVWGFTLTR